MKISREKVRETLGKDDFDFVNAKIDFAMDSARSALLAAIGYRDGDKVPMRNAKAFDALSDTYIVEYSRGILDKVDNEKMLTVIAVQLETLLYNSVK